MANYLTTMSGTIGAGEVFTHSLAVTSLLDQGQVATVVSQAFALAHAQNITGWELALSGQVTYLDASAAEIANLATGELNAATHVAYAVPGLQGSGVAGAFQVAGCVSLTAGVRPNGTPLRGRFYLPLVGTSATSNGFFQTTVQAGVADTVGFFLGELEENGVQPAVWSRTLASLQAVTSARFGSVPDTIRSRRNGLTEVYEPITITPVP